MAILVVSPLFAYTAYAGSQEGEIAAANERERTRLLVGFVQARHRQLLESVRQLLFLVSRIPAVVRQDRASCESTFQEILGHYPGYGNLGAVRLDGEVFASALPLASPANDAERRYFQRVLSTRDFSVGDLAVSRATGRPVLVFGYPVAAEDGTLLAVVFASLELDYLAELERTASLPPGAEVTLWDGSGAVLARVPASPGSSGRSSAGQALFQSLARQNGGGSGESRGLDGIVREYAFTPLIGRSEGGDVFLAIGVPRDLADVQVRRIVLRNLWMLGAVTLFAVLCALAGGDRLIVRLFGRLQELASRDALTGLRSRRDLLDSGEQELARCRRLGHSLGVVMLDVDHFKAVNDTHGHGAGDDALKAIAVRIQEAIRADDLLGRYGGEEYLLFLPEMDPKAALEAAGSILERIGSTPLKTRKGELGLTLSAGVAVASPGSHEPLAGLIETADQALYQAKRSGRNCVRMAPLGGVPEAISHAL